MKQKRDLVINSVDILVLASFAIAQPIFELLSRNVEFFIARHSEPLEVILLVLGLCLFLPVVIVLFEILADAVTPKFRRAVHSVVLAVLFALILLPLLKRVGDSWNWIGGPGTDSGLCSFCSLSEVPDRTVFPSFSVTGSFHFSCALPVSFSRLQGHVWWRKIGGYLPSG